MSEISTSLSIDEAEDPKWCFRSVQIQSAKILWEGEKIMENGALGSLPLKDEFSLSLTCNLGLLIVALFQVSRCVVDMSSPCPAICLI